MEKGWRVIPLTGERMHIMFITEDKDSIIAQIPNWIKYDNNRVA